MSTTLSTEPTVSASLDNRLPAARQRLSQRNDPERTSGLARLLQCRRTGLFWAGGAWTPNLEFATNFRDSGEAISVCVERDLDEVELVIRIPGMPQDVFRAAVR